MITIDWGSFLLVASVSIAAAVVLSAAYAGGVRLLAATRGPDGSHRSAPGAMAGAVVLFAVGIAAVLLGLWLAIPAFH